MVIYSLFSGIVCEPSCFDYAATMCSILGDNYLNELRIYMLLL